MIVTISSRPNRVLRPDTCAVFSRSRAFGRLPPKLQAAATLALIEEQPYKEIAEALGISTGAVKLRVFRALRFLRKELKQQGIEP